jgi:hypothetical protein
MKSFCVRVKNKGDGLYRASNKTAYICIYKIPHDTHQIIARYHTGKELWWGFQKCN